MGRLVGPLLAAAVAWSAPAVARAELEPGRKATRQQLSVEVERVQLPNGLTVLLAPDAAVSSVAVWMTFRAGTVHEPPGRAGMAHLVEHVMASGPTPATDYQALLEARRARHFNAATGVDQLSFQAVVPAEELPAALWVAADRLATLPALVDEALVERHRRVVLEERKLRTVDAPYGLVEEHLFGRLFPGGHPLRAGVGGAPEELARVTAGDVRTFVAERLVPANAVLAVVGRFDPAQARRLVEEGLGRLPGGQRAPAPSLPPPPELPYVDQRPEPLARRPRVSLAWRLPFVSHAEATALRLGGQLLALYTDGAFGMRLDADVAEYPGESVFQLDVTVPYDEPMPVVHRDAESFLRLLTVKELPVEHLQVANLLLDRAALFELDGLAGRATALSWLEWLPGRRLEVADHLGWHWALGRDVVRDTARVLLREAPDVVMHARPTRPRPARLERE
jgi:zinc protease